MRILVLASLLLLPLASADLFATNEEVATGANNIEYGFGAPADGKAYAAFGQAATTYTTAFSGSLDVDYAPGTWDVMLQLSCDQPTAYRPTSDTNEYRPTLAATLFVAEQTIGVGYGESTARTCDGPDDIWELVFSFDVTDATRTAGTAVRLDVNVWWLNPPPGEAQNGYFVLGAEGTRIAGMVPATTAPEATAPIVAALNQTTLTFDEPTTASYRLWHNGTASENLSVLGATPGASIQVLDGAQQLVYNATQAANETVVLNGTAGNWTVVVELVDFVGSLDIQLAPHVAAAPGTTTSTSGTANPTTSDTTTSTGNATTDAATDDGDEDAPGWPVALLLVALVVVARRVR